MGEATKSSTGCEAMPCRHHDNSSAAARNAFPDIRAKIVIITCFEDIWSAKLTKNPHSSNNYTLSGLHFPTAVTNFADNFTTYNTIHVMRKLLLSLLAILSLAVANAAAGTFTPGKGTFLMDGKPFVVKAAELHYPRIPRPYWEQRIRMCKALGMNTVCLYVFWNVHEQQPGVFDFSGQNDLREFIRLCQTNGMYVILRPGPYVCAEWEMGGLPWWLLRKKDIRLREDDPYFMERVALFEEKVAEQVADMTISRGGPK